MTQIISIICLFIFSLHVYAEQLKVNVSAHSAILINAESGAILFAKNPTMPCQPASTTKIATALYALHKKGRDLDTMITASPEAMRVVPPRIKRLDQEQHPPFRLTTDGTHMNLKVGESLSLRDLLYGLMLSSGNDAANVIAEFVSSSIPQFMHELNAYFKTIGCKHTFFRNPHGLPDPEHVTTVEEMAKISIEAMKYPLFAEIVKTRQHPRPQTNKQAASTLFQRNKLLQKSAFFYPKAIGIKTGYTDAGYTLVAAAQEGGRTLIAVLFGYKESTQRFKDAISLFEAAFAETKQERILLTKDHERFTRKVKGGKRDLEAAFIEDVKISYFPAEEPKLKAILCWDALKLPIQEGDRVGEVRMVSEKGTIVHTASLFAKQDIAPTFLAQVGNLYELAKAKKALVAALSGLSLVGLGVFMVRCKSRLR